MKISWMNKVVIWGMVVTLVIAVIAGPATYLRSSTLASYIIQAVSSGRAAEAVLTCGGVQTSVLDLIHSVGANLTAAQVICVQAKAGVLSLSRNSSVEVVAQPQPGGEEEVGNGGNTPATDYPDVTGASLLWQAENVTGAGITVAVVDTGIGNHQGLVRGIDGKQGRVVGWVDLVEGKKQPTDPNGHGTHVAGVIANSQIGADGEWNGIAPGVNLVGVRVLGADGSGTYEKVIQGIQWVVAHKAEYNIRVLNLSLVAPATAPYFVDPLDRAVTAAWASGLVVVVAAGNEGPKPMSISVPGNNPYAITAGAYTDHFTPGDFTDDYLADFSAAGPTLDGFAKPDVLAPGGHILSTVTPNSNLVRNHGRNLAENQYFSMSGTSQAAAAVSGVVALVLSRNPGLSPDQVKYRILASAMPWMSTDPDQAIYSIWQQGYGRLNAPDAVLADLNGKANQGMDIKADLAGTTHYEGYSYYDSATGLFRLRGADGSTTNSYWTWNGQYPGTGAIGAWSGAIGAWSGAIGAWSGAIGAWSGAIGAWSGAIGAWSGAIGAWSGGFTTWAGGVTAWTGSEPWAEQGLNQASFVTGFKSGKSNSTLSSISATRWVEEH